MGELGIESGIESGINYQSAVSLLASSKITAEEKNRLRYIFEGRVPTNQRAAKAKKDPSLANCTRCSCNVVETSEHISRECSAYAHCRAAVFASTSEAERASWPSCFWNAGIPPIHPELLAIEASLGLDFDIREDPPPARSADDAGCELIIDGKLVVAGDGACSDQGTTIARAGFGAFFGEGHSHNFSDKLVGPAQDSDRAELRAFVRVVRWAFAPTLYLTDNDAVRAGFYKLLAGSTRPWKEHGDLWDVVGKAVAARGAEFFAVKYVPGHTTAADIASGRITAEKHRRNGQADKLAVQGAALHAVPVALKMQLRRQRNVTMQWQRALLAIHAERTHLWQADQISAVLDELGPDDADDGVDLDAEIDRQINLRKIMLSPSTTLPRYCWVQPCGGKAFRLQPLPKQIGAAKKAGDRVKGNPLHNPWQYGFSLIEPLYWFWSSIKWTDDADAGAEKVDHVSIAELVILFQLLTGVLPTKDATGTETLQVRVHWFQCASRRLGQLTKGKFTPGREIPANEADVLRRLRFQHGPAIAGRPCVPNDYWQHFIAVFLRAHLSVLNFGTEQGTWRRSLRVGLLLGLPPPLMSLCAAGSLGSNCLQVRLCCRRCLYLGHGLLSSL